MYLVGLNFQTFQLFRHNLALPTMLSDLENAQDIHQLPFVDIHLIDGSKT